MRLFRVSKQEEFREEQAHQAAVYDRGYMRCQRCHEEMSLDGLTPLQMAECPKCGDMNFVPLRIGHFWLYEPLGGGGMGSVYKAVNSTLVGRYFAVKVLARNAKDKLNHIQALLNEAHIAKVIGDHPSLVTCAAGGYADGEYFCALDFAEGERLDQRIERTDGIPEAEVLQLALDILDAEKHIYQCGYLYRDLKPENVIISPQGRPILFDYGLCVSREEAHHPKEEYVSGSPYYLPPERLYGTAEDAYSEIYSLGMVMYKALSNKTYYQANEVEALAKKHVSKLRVSSASKMKGFRPELVQVMSRMIKQDPEERYQSFEEAKADVEALKS